MTLISVKYLGQVEDDGEEDDWHDVLEDPTKARVLVIHRLQIQTIYSSRDLKCEENLIYLALCSNRVKPPTTLLFLLLTVFLDTRALGKC